MMEDQPKFYKLNYSGKFEEIITETPLELFTLYTILAIYIPKEKRMYIWVSKNATQSLRKFIPQIRQLFNVELPDLRILRNITIESGEEPFDFFEKLDFSKNQLEEHVDAQESKIKPAISEINELKEKSEDLIEKEEYMEAIKISDQIIESAQRIDDKALIKDQEDLIANLKERNKLKNLVSHIIEEGNRIKEKYEELISSEKFIEAHKIVNQFVQENGEDTDLKSIPEIEELLLKEENMWYNFKIEQESNIQTLKHFESQIETCLDNKFYLQASDVIAKAKDLLSLVGDEELENQWKEIERTYFEQRGKSELFEKYDTTIIEVNTCIENSQFEEAISKLESLSEEMIGEEFQDHKKKLNEIKENLLVEKEKLEQFNKEFRDLDENLKKEQEKMNYDDALYICKKIIEVATTHEKKEVVKKYTSLATEIELEAKDENFRKVKEKLIELEERIQKEQEEKNLPALLISFEEIIEFAKSNEKNDIVEKYSQLSEDVEQELKELEKRHEEIKEKISNLIEEVSMLRDDGKFEEAIGKIDIILENKNDSAFSEHLVKLEEIKNELIIEKESREKFNKELQELEGYLEDSRKSNNLEAVLNDCRKIVELAMENEKIEIVEKYKQVSNQIKIEIEEKQAKFEEELKGLEEIIHSEKEKKNYEMVIDNCEKIVELAKGEEKSDIVQKYKQIIEEVKFEREKLENFEEIKEKINTLSKESIESLNKSAFQKSLDNFDKIINLLEDYNEKY